MSAQVGFAWCDLSFQGAPDIKIHLVRFLFVPTTVLWCIRLFIPTTVLSSIRTRGRFSILCLFKSVARVSFQCYDGKLFESKALACFVSLMTSTTRACTHANARIRSNAHAHMYDINGSRCDRHAEEIIAMRSITYLCLAWPFREHHETVVFLVEATLRAPCRH